MILNVFLSGLLHSLIFPPSDVRSSYLGGTDSTGNYYALYWSTVQDIYNRHCFKFLTTVHCSTLMLHCTQIWAHNQLGRPHYHTMIDTYYAYLNSDTTTSLCPTLLVVCTPVLQYSSTPVVVLYDTLVLQVMIYWNPCRTYTTIEFGRYVHFNIFEKNVFQILKSPFRFPSIVQKCNKRRHLCMVSGK